MATRDRHLERRARRRLEAGLAVGWLVTTTGLASAQAPVAPAPVAPAPVAPAPVAPAPVAPAPARATESAAPAPAAPVPAAPAGAPPAAYGAPVPAGYPPMTAGGPVRIKYDPALPPPVGYHLVRRPQRGFIVGGAIPFGIFYGISLLEAVSRSPDYETDALAIPVLGPFVAINRTDNCAGVEQGELTCKTKRDLKYVWYGFDGAMQVTGATLIALGIALPSRWYYRDDLAVAVVPARFGRDGAGFAVTGRF